MTRVNFIYVEQKALLSPALPKNGCSSSLLFLFLSTMVEVHSYGNFITNYGRFCVLKKYTKIQVRNITLSLISIIFLEYLLIIPQNQMKIVDKKFKEL